MSLFEITQIGTFEDIKDQIFSIPELEVWKVPPGGVSTHVRQQGKNFWLDCIDFGAINVDCQSKKISTYPHHHVNLDSFAIFLSHEWLPMVYQICGTQVLHASAVVNKTSNQITAFCGDSGSGKSTFGYGFAKHLNGLQIADDHLAFNFEDNKVKPVHIQDYVHLRPKSAFHFDQQPYQFEPIDWMDGEPTLNSVIFLSPKDDQLSQNEKSFELTFINKVNAYELLLKQAFALTTKLVAHNQKMIVDYLALAHQVKAYRLRYKVGFEHLNEIFDGIASEIF